ncbi:hemolysin III family protein [Candidatus Woesearchaeota archaeon]|nr:hemolysin III family protein [Candidatus Woesearchaeota archaeon]
MKRAVNEPLSSLIHLAGFFLAIAALVVLVVFAARHKDAWAIVAFSIFGASMMLLYLFSTLYHLVPSSSRAKEVFRRIDKSMIYVLIAGTYTAVCLTVLRGWWGWSLLGVTWAIAVTGIALSSATRMKAWLSTALYLAMGWLGVVAIYPLVQELPAQGLWWLLAGGIFYTLGAAFFSLDSIVPRARWFGMHEIFHVLVIAGSFSHSWLLLNFVL